MTETDASPEVVCTLGEADLADQGARWERVLERAEMLETMDGIRAIFPNDVGIEAELRALVATENECCAWATWRVTKTGGSVLLDVTSTGDGVSALHAMFVSLS
jgi:hypothetical protein